VIVANNLHGDYQLANGYGYDKAKMVLEVCLWALTFFGICWTNPLLLYA
jgi:hypothetical protein